MKHKASGTEARVIADIIERQRLGILRYGITVEKNPFPLREWLKHAYEEHLDASIYLRRAIEEIDTINQTTPCKPHSSKTIISPTEKRPD